MISDLLGHGKAAAITGKDLAIMTGVNLRGVTAMIERERRDGKPICAVLDGSTRGYFLPANRDELKEYLLLLGSRINNLAITHKACAAQLEDLPA